MRTIILAAGLLAFLAVSPGAYAGSSDGTATTSGQVAKSKVKKVKTGVTGGAGATTGTVATDLTASECTTLGGTVYEGGGFCKSGKYCGTTDENGGRHRVCVEAAK